MTALVRYYFATVLHTQRHLAPLLLFAALLAVLTVNGSGPIPPAYASSAGALFPAATWLTVVLAGTDDAPQRAVVRVSAGGWAKVLAGTVLTALLCCLVLLCVGLVLPLWTGTYEVGGAALLLGVEAQLTTALTGIAIGLPCSRLLFGRQGYALVAALALVMAGLFVKGLPPVNRLLRLMATQDDPARLVGPAAGMLASAALLLAFSAALTHFLAVRGD
ncbi:hypothetical protein [Streptomyces sp. NPDC050504]|uniref:hypothetical protein n=1 Tax=Streptomyces sp. NPDC050504 TaxID=3365618 RepID=UPI003795C510